MAKIKTRYVCSNCGSVSSRWLGRCPQCGEWNTMVEETVAPEAPKAAQSMARSGPASQAASLADIAMEDMARLETGIGELDRVLGGGIVPGALILLSGDPGIGKSTLVLQLAAAVCDKNGTVLYGSGEESAGQIKMRAQRLGISTPDLIIQADTSLDHILDEAKKRRPALLVVDSIQTMYSQSVEGTPGRLAQIRENTSRLMTFAKSEGIPVVVIGHVTKDGAIAGPRMMEHMVDVVLYFEGERNYQFRILRGIKNRFGATNEIGVFEMMDWGLKEVENPSEMLLSGRPKDAPGTCVTCAMEGARPVLAEVQALIAPASAANPRRMSNGFDYNRFAMLLAVLEKRGNLKVSQCDAYLNIIGGLTLEEPAADLSAVVAIASSYLDKPVPSHMAAIGEVGLSGEIRSINHMEQRLSEVQRLGFTQCIVPAHRAKEMKELPHLELLPVQNVAQALQLLVQGKLMK